MWFQNAACSRGDDVSDAIAILRRPFPVGVFAPYFRPFVAALLAEREFDPLMSTGASARAARKVPPRLARILRSVH
jgi:hypothetical protein